jgi:hypothetical protein
MVAVVVAVVVVVVADQNSQGLTHAKAFFFSIIKSACARAREHACVGVV